MCYLRPANVSVFADTTFTNELDRHSRYGFTVFLGACLISWISKCTTMVCLSTSEAEFVAATEATKDVIWIRDFLNELGLLPTSASTIYEDNQACVAMISNHSVSSRNRHFAVKMFWLREQVQNRVVTLRLCHPNEISQIFFPRDTQFCSLRYLLMNGVLTRGEC